ncbi:MAG: substrate-binding domain-containing protein [Lachnospiraceae bacterium]|nr:substrate-binding domain-containing protein [Lachnospiraceae bacterium]
MKKKSVTFQDIADYTHFSKTTISRYFNNPDSLTVENQDIIAKALIELDYKENKVAKILASGKTEFVGISIPNLYYHYYSELLTRLLHTYETYGYKFLVFSESPDPEVQRRYIQELLAYKIEGMIVLSHVIPSKELASYHIPLVTIEREDQFTCSVNTDNYMGGLQAASLLYKNHCDILIHGNADISPDVPAYGRIKGFMDICEERQIPYELCLHHWGNTFEENRAEIKEFLEYLDDKYKGKRKGIFMSNDTHANILLNLLLQKYGTLPDDYRIIGFDNSPVSREAVIPISTVGQQIDVIADEAMKILVSQMEERKKRRPEPLKELIHKVVPPILICRETSKRE